MRTIQKIENEMETRTLRNLTKHLILGLFSILKKNYRFVLGTVVAIAGSLLLGGSLWWWLAGVFVGKVVARLLLTVALTVILYFLIYILIYASIIGGILWILIG